MLPADVREYVASSRDEVIGLLADMVAIDSVTGGETAFGEFCRDWLEHAGIDARLVPCKGRQNLVAQCGSADPGAPTLVISGHLDTVPADAARWSRDPLDPVVRDGRMHGLGTSDLKASIAAAFVAARHLRDAQLAGRVVIAMTVEEETTGDGTREFLAWALAERFLDPTRTVAVVTEPTGLDHVSLGNRGTCFAAARIVGSGGHGSRPHLARNPIDAAHELLAALPALRERWARTAGDPDLGASQVTPTSISAGARARLNMIPESADLVLDCRVNRPLWSAEFAGLARDLELVSQLVRDREFDVTWELLHRRGGHKLAAEHPLARLGLDVLRSDLGVARAEFRYTPAGNDAVFFGQHGIPALNKVGPGHPECAHRVDEYVELDNLPRGVALFAQLGRRFAAEAFEENPGS